MTSSENLTKSMAWKCFGVSESWWNDGANGSNLEGEQVMIRAWMLEIEILVMVQLLVMTWYKANCGYGGWCLDMGRTRFSEVSKLRS